MESTTFGKTLTHQYHLPFLTAITPELSTIHFNNFQKIINKRNFELPNDFQNGLKFCKYCQIVLIPGINLKMRIIFIKKNSLKLEKKIMGNCQRIRKLRYSCLNCNKFTDFDVYNPNLPQFDNKNQNKEFVAIWSSSSNKSNLSNSKNNSINKPSNNAKERAKKRKKSNLSNLLQNKRDEEAKEKNLSSLNLNEFMKL
ncbi:hypothetical protein WICMUC_004584 [Wickerhamomyces mucosus]|uniref:Uncharacterized protein n=1 Tax=Wickerhamomyces mucosus TaxID=1378264 RepID=A0A9P8PGC4_9ASCO|nr:hypothetical protein WICMUC_004584 [Wickerhamomyces mucosus]